MYSHIINRKELNKISTLLAYSTLPQDKKHTFLKDPKKHKWPLFKDIKNNVLVDLGATDKKEIQFIKGSRGPAPIKECMAQVTSKPYIPQINFKNCHTEKDRVKKIINNHGTPADIKAEIIKEQWTGTLKEAINFILSYTQLSAEGQKITEGLI